jgi:DNA-3-methyladenine glycosylase II
VFLIFCVKHPDILPHADLAIQKGILRWYTTALLPSKDEEGGGSLKQKAEQGNAGLTPPPIPVGCPLSRQDLARRLTKPLKPGLFLTPLEMGTPLHHSRNKEKIFGSPCFSALFNSKQSEVLCSWLTNPLDPICFVLSKSILEQLTEQWKPYRSLPVCYMWSLTGFVPEC